MKYLPFLLLLVLIGCRERLDGFVDPDRPSSGRAMAFSASVADTSAVVGKGIPYTESEFPDGETFGLLAYLSSQNNPTQNYIYDKPITRQGNEYAYQGAEYWPDGPLRFFAYAPYGGAEAMPSSAGAVPAVRFTAARQVKDQIELLAAATAPMVYASTVPLRFEHALTKVGFSVRKSGLPGTVRLVRIVLLNVVEQGILALNGFEWSPSTDFEHTVGYTLSTADGTLRDQEATADYATATSDNGWLMMVPQPVTAGRMLVAIDYTVDGLAARTETTLPEGAWVRGRTMNYQITLAPAGGDEAVVVDEATASANSLLLDPTTSGGTATKHFSIPVVQVNRFYGNAAYAPYYGQATGLDAATDWAVDVVWQTAANLVSITDATGTGPSDRFTVAVKSGATGNALVGIFKDPNRNGIQDPDEPYLWSWHLWITPYNPNVSVAIDPSTGAGAWDVPHGRVHRYRSGTEGNGDYGSMAAWDPSTGLYAGLAIMDRNLGAMGAGFPTLESGIPFAAAPLAARQRPLDVLYYQYGRKDPFLSDAYRYRADGAAINSIEKVSAPITILSAIQNPEKYPIGRSYWASDGPTEEVHWYDPLAPAQFSGTSGAKSIYDPCPAGWRLPVNGTWSDFSTSTALWNAAARSRDYQIDEGHQAVYPLVGFRNASQGNVSQTGYHGCYWSCSPVPASNREYMARLVSPDDNLFEATVYPGVVRPSDAVYQTDSFSVRCVQDR